MANGSGRFRDYSAWPISLFTAGLTSSASKPAAPAKIAVNVKIVTAERVSSWAATSPATRLPRAEAMNQTPIICPSRPRGASLVIAESPIGDSASSPHVNRK